MAFAEDKKVIDLDDARSDPTLTRRRFLTWGIVGVSAGIGGVLAVPLVGYFIAPAVQGTDTFTTLTAVGKVSDFANLDKPKQVTLKANYTDSYKPAIYQTNVYVLALKKPAQAVGDFRVLSSICTHAGCTVTYLTKDNQYAKAGQFYCPCHNSVYDSNGKNLAVAPRPLDTYQLQIKDGQMFITLQLQPPKAGAEGQQTTAPETTKAPS